MYPRALDWVTREAATHHCHCHSGPGHTGDPHRNQELVLEWDFFRVLKHENFCFTLNTGFHLNHLNVDSLDIVATGDENPSVGRLAGPSAPAPSLLSLWSEPEPGHQVSEVCSPEAGLIWDLETRGQAPANQRIAAKIFEEI